ncbi:MAG: anti-sigma factor antagonist [Ignavibacteria bacterium CG_4_8_14_3_um_filter_37_9]|nr:STAS domain-containing protein [Ignavibacteria bacterium]OIO23243.1 MAG: anti-anti-sigma factor [Ignavibacteria bacterium CG1_02_37_35]PIP77586.1 MAG: anti-anti-sigma factor [Ignavibacteria bacterium CG22_combo_CG10-13_8_21_14_all_37_15]PIS45368.1 MAG: anti-sigma factor antagonist [Ignavibacteria bacterium CG08_land_8_20_14_0_20_37_9]PIX00352.1 MAG: anti-sigma factor antagonist [Ignavibacteria bacterium CG_4_8_14_3_um_filter_37_9]PIX94453.1 MAG: anti-sigma factor antagonist [Ignavibacteria 
MAEFSTTHRENGEVNIIELNGYLDAHTAQHLEIAISDLIVKNKYKVVVNFERLKYISSAGLGVFMAFIETMRSNSGDIKLAAMQPSVYNIFDLLGFPLLYEIFPTETEAVNKFNQ